MVQQPQWARASLSRLYDHTRSHITRQNSSGRLITLTQRPPPDNTQHSQQTDTHAPGVIRTHNPSERPATDPRLWPHRIYKYSLLFLLRQWTITKYETNPYKTRTCCAPKTWFYEAVCRKIVSWVTELRFCSSIIKRASDSFVAVKSELEKKKRNER